MSAIWILLGSLGWMTSAVLALGFVLVRRHAPKPERPAPWTDDIRHGSYIHYPQTCEWLDESGVIVDRQRMDS